MQCFSIFFSKFFLLPRLLLKDYFSLNPVKKFRQKVNTATAILQENPVFFHNFKYIICHFAEFIPVSLLYFNRTFMQKGYIFWHTKKIIMNFIWPFIMEGSFHMGSKFASLRFLDLRSRDNVEFSHLWKRWTPSTSGRVWPQRSHLTWKHSVGSLGICKQWFQNKYAPWF